MSDVRQGYEDLFTVVPLDAPERGLRLIGELDMSALRQLEDALEGTSGEGQATLDLSELTFIDSTGLQALVQYARSEDGNGPVILKRPSPFVLRLLEIADLKNHPALEIRS